MRGADHARIVAEDIPGATLQVVCDASSDRAKKIANAFGATHATSDPFATIADHHVDAVLIASPDSTHAPLTVAAIAAGPLCMADGTQAGCADSDQGRRETARVSSGAFLCEWRTHL